MAKIVVGEKVKVKDWGGIFSTDTCYMLRLHNNRDISDGLLARWAFGDSTHYDKQLRGIAEPNLTYFVLFVDENTGRLLISSSMTYGKVYCIKSDSIVTLRPIYTKQELIDKLGYDFDLVDDETGKLIC